MSSYSHFYSKKFQHICVSLDVYFNESLTNDVVSFEQLGPAFFYQMFFIHNYHRMTIPFYGLHAAGMNSFMGLDQDVNSCLSLYIIA